MAHLRGVDVVGQGFATGIQNLLQSLAQQYAEKQRRDQVQSLVSGLLSRQNPTMGYAQNMGVQAVNPNDQSGSLPDLGNMNIPAERPQQLGNQFENRPGVPLVSQQNLAEILQLQHLDPNAWALIQSMQPKWQELTSGATFGTTNPQGVFTAQGRTADKPSTTVNKPTTFWSDVIDQTTNLPTIDKINGSDMIKQTRIELNPTNGSWEQKFQWVPANKSASGKPQRNQLVYTNEGFKSYNPYANRWEQVKGEAEAKWKLAPDTARTMETSLVDNGNSVKSVEEVLNRGSLVGPVAGRTQKLGNRFFNNAEFETLRARVGQLRTLIYGLSGKQINESEQDWLQNDILPAVDQPDQNFEAKLKELKSWLVRRRTALHEQYPELNKTSKIPTPPTAKPTGTNSGKYKILKVE
jgi:hypothetical protein